MRIKVLFLTLLAASTVSAEQELPNKSLKELIEISKTAHPQVDMDRWEIEAASLEKNRVDGEFAPRLKARIGVGPITEVTGNSLSTVQDRDHFGAAYLGSLEFTWPIYAWGRKTTLKRAANLGQSVKENESLENESQRIYEIKEAYFGVLYARTMIDFIEGHKEKLSGILSGLQENKKKKNDVYHLEVLLSQLNIKLAEAKAALQTADMGLAVRTGHDLRDKISLKDQWLTPKMRKKQPLSFYQEMVLADHPKLKMISSGIEAKASLAESESKSRWPVIAMLARYDYSYASVRDDQQSVFAYDPYNRSDLTVGLGFEWGLQLGLPEAKRDKFLAEKEVLQAQKRLAEAGLAGLVSKAWFDLERAESRLDAAKDGNKSAKKLWNRNAMSWGAGLASSEEISQAFTTRALATKDYYEAIYAYEMAWAALSKAAGREIDPKLQPK